MARLLKRGLEEEGHAVDVAGDGPEGLWLATENSYGAVVLDVMLPGFDGFELCRKLRAAGGLPADVRGYRSLLITLEHSQLPKEPGTVVLRGAWPL